MMRLRLGLAAATSFDLQDADHRGFHTGLTFGISGGLVEYSDDLVFVYRNGKGPDYQASYKHLTHTTIGNNVAAPAGAAATNPAGAFHKVMEDGTMDFVSDLQSQGGLAH